MLDLFLGVVVRGESCRFCLLGMDALFESRDRALWTDQKKKKTKLKAQIDNGTDASGTSKEVCSS